jgi:hypothetical protein
MTATARDYRALPSCFAIAEVRTPPHPPGPVGSLRRIRVRVYTTHGDVWVDARPDDYGWRPEPGPISVTVDHRALPVALADVCPDALVMAVEGAVLDALKVATGEGWWCS